MSGYDNSFDSNAFAGAYDMPDSLNAESTLTMNQSGHWNAALPTQSGLVEGGTAAQLNAQLHFAPMKGARSNGECVLHSPNPATSTEHSPVDSGAKYACAVCLASFQTTHALDNHAREGSHQAYKCKCGTGFTKHSTLQRHIHTKDTPNIFACTLCSDKFTRKDKLKDHCRHYHRVTDDGLLVLFASQQVNARPGAPTRRRRAPVLLSAAASGPAPTQAPAPPNLAPASTGPPVWSSPASTGQQYANFSADLFVPTGSFATASSFLPTGSFDSSGAFVPAASSVAATAAPGEDILDTLDDILGDTTWTTNFDEFSF